MDTKHFEDTFKDFQKEYDNLIIKAKNDKKFIPKLLYVTKQIAEVDFYSSIEDDIKANNEADDMIKNFLPYMLSYKILKDT